MLIYPEVFHSQVYKKEKIMGPRHSQLDHEGRGEVTTKIEENNLNVGLLNFQEESFNLKPEHRIELGVIFIIMILIIFSTRIWMKRCCKKQKQKNVNNLQTTEQHQMAPQIIST